MTIILLIVILFLFGYDGSSPTVECPEPGSNVSSEAQAS